MRWVAAAPCVVGEAFLARTPAADGEGFIIGASRVAGQANADVSVALPPAGLHRRLSGGVRSVRGMPSSTVDS
jgi:hypothetical protein